MLSCSVVEAKAASISTGSKTLFIHGLCLKLTKGHLYLKVERPDLISPARVAKSIFTKQFSKIIGMRSHAKWTNLLTDLKRASETCVTAVNYPDTVDKMEQIF